MFTHCWMYRLTEMWMMINICVEWSKRVDDHSRLNIKSKWTVLEITVTPILLIGRIIISCLTDVINNCHWHFVLNMQNEWTSVCDHQLSFTENEWGGVNDHVMLNMQSTWSPTCVCRVTVTEGQVRGCKRNWLRVSGQMEEKLQICGDISKYSGKIFRYAR